MYSTHERALSCKDNTGISVNKRNRMIRIPGAQFRTGQLKLYAASHSPRRRTSAAARTRRCLPQSAPVAPPPAQTPPPPAPAPRRPHLRRTSYRAPGATAARFQAQVQDQNRSESEGWAKEARSGGRGLTAPSSRAVDAEDAAAANRYRGRRRRCRSGGAEVAAGIVRGVGGGADGEACGGRPTAEAAGRRREREARRAQAMWAAWGGEASCRHSSRLPLKRCWWVVAVLICARWSFRLVGAVAGGSCVRCVRREDEEEEECGSGTLQVRAADKEQSGVGTLPSLSSAARLLLRSCPCFVESLGRTRADRLFVSLVYCAESTVY
jgi:hypothetical protein